MFFNMIGSIISKNLKSTSKGVETRLCQVTHNFLDFFHLFSLTTRKLAAVPNSDLDEGLCQWASMQRFRFRKGILSPTREKRMRVRDYFSRRIADSFSDPACTCRTLVFASIVKMIDGRQGSIGSKKQSCAVAPIGGEILKRARLYDSGFNLKSSWP